MGTEISKTKLIMTKEELRKLNFYEMKLIEDNYNITWVLFITPEELTERYEQLRKGKCWGRMRCPKSIM